MSGYPWIKQFGQEWRAAYAICDTADARGAASMLWLLADLSRQRGYLLESDGSPYTLEALAELAKVPMERMATIAVQMRRAGMMLSDGDGRYFFPWMVQETAERNTSKERKQGQRTKCPDVVPQMSQQCPKNVPRQIQRSDSESDAEVRKDTLSPTPLGQSAPPLRPEPAENAERERPQGFDALIDNTRIKALCDAYPPSRGGRAYGVAARAVQVLADEKYGGDCNAATAFLAARVQAWAASAKGRDLAARGFMPAFGNWLRDKCYDEPDADWAVVPVAAPPTNNGVRKPTRESYLEILKREGKLTA